MNNLKKDFDYEMPNLVDGDALEELSLESNDDYINALKYCASHLLWEHLRQEYMPKFAPKADAIFSVLRAGSVSVDELDERFKDITRAYVLGRIRLYNSLNITLEENDKYRLTGFATHVIDTYEDIARELLDSLQK